MAKYKITYACGHGEHVVHLYGPENERARRIAWMEKNIVCPECYRQRKADEPLTAEVIVTTFGHTGIWLCITKGDTYAIKDKLKSIGCVWMEYAQDLLGLAPRRAWGLKLADRADQVTAEKFVEAWQKMQSVGVKELIIDPQLTAWATALQLYITREQGA